MGNLGETPLFQVHLFHKTQNQAIPTEKPKPKTMPRFLLHPYLSFGAWSPKLLSRWLSGFRLLPGVCVCCQCHHLLHSFRPERSHRPQTIYPSGRSKRKSAIFPPIPPFKSPGPNFHMLCEGPVPPPPCQSCPFSQARLTGKYIPLPPC